MKVKVLKEFFDKQENTMRRVGDEFEVTDARFKEIDAILPQFLEVKKEAKAKPQTKAKAKK
jgi:hypothetical protein